MRTAGLLVCFCALEIANAQELLDTVDQALSFSIAHDQVRGRFSGLIDLEGYEFSQPAPGLIFSDHHALFNPRLSLFLDSQLGPKFYFFAQARFDRGFDPADDPFEARLDEYALRFTPWEDGRFNVQIGQFATIVGNWIPRHLSWDNPFINAPLPYENITPVSDTDIPPYFEEFFEPGGEKYDRNPVIWGPSYATGVSLAGRMDKFELAAEIKNAPLSSRPESWKTTEVGFDHPTMSARVGYRPNEMWNFGVSASDGAYLRPEAAGALPAGSGLGDFRQQLIGQDVSFAWHHLQLWAEFYEARWEVPNVGNADTFVYYFESKYKITAQLFAAARWNQQFFSTLRSPDGAGLCWAHDLWRAEAALGYRFTAHTQLKLQYSLQHESSADSNFGHILAAQFTLRF
jgi:hypothetical protein